jgi:hypothetical protein
MLLDSLGVGVRGTCYACGSPAEHQCGLCGTVACSGHTGRLPGFEALFCGECVYAMGLLHFERLDDRSWP